MGHAGTMPSLSPLSCWAGLINLGLYGLMSGAAAQEAPPRGGGSYTSPVSFAAGLQFGVNGRSVADQYSEGEYGWAVDVTLGNKVVQPWAQYSHAGWGGFTGGDRIQPISGAASSYVIGFNTPRKRLIKSIQLDAGAGLGFVSVQRSSHPADDSYLVLFRSGAAIPVSRTFAVRLGTQLRYDAVYESSLVWLFSAAAKICLPRSHCRRTAPTN
ncbi:hypothetical protein BH23GEM10_BH23GEM10_12230 [soil metagenome]